MHSLFRGLLFLFLAAPLHALELPAIFSSGMVLQRDMPVPVWGRAEPGKQVAVSFGPHKATVIVGAEGEWRIDLPPLAASNDPQELVVVEESFVDPSGGQPNVSNSTITLTDVLVGDVWHCSGQSNMEWSVQKSQDAEAEIAAADNALIRHFKVPRTDADTPQFSSGGRWQSTRPDTVGSFTAVGYYFARQVHHSQGVPIGLVNTAWGGASAEAFTAMDTLLADPYTAKHVEKMKARSPDSPKFRKQHTPAALYHGMIHTVAPFAHRGVLWYQGESNSGRGAAYRELMPRMIEDWRELWEQPGEQRDTPFLMVQLAHFKEFAVVPPVFDGWGELRDSQAAIAASVPNVHLATAIDIGDANDIHPRNKQEVGQRLARLAEYHVYGDESVVPIGPTFRELGQAETTGGDGVRGVVIEFDHAEGLTTTDGQPARGFALRRVGGEGPWVWAETRLSDNRVLLLPPEGMAGPFEVRYAYGINPTDGPQGINLVNGEGLPAMPFRTDPVPR
ncbi:MAG: sialate O-acetylesterase [Planctomycetota bacterium]